MALYHRNTKIMMRSDEHEKTLSKLQPIVITEKQPFSVPGLLQAGLPFLLCAVKFGSLSSSLHFTQDAKSVRHS